MCLYEKAEHRRLAAPEKQKQGATAVARRLDTHLKALLGFLLVIVPGREVKTNTSPHNQT